MLKEFATTKQLLSKIKKPKKRTSKVPIRDPYPQIKLNSAQCTHCGDILVSEHVHDFVSCSCRKQSVAILDKWKGKRYTKDGRWTQKYIEFVSAHNCGIFIDGGKEYLRRGGNFKHFKDLSK